MDKIGQILKRCFNLSQKYRKKLVSYNYDWVIVVGLMLIATLSLVLNIFKPLWYDEVWRAYEISAWRFDGGTPMTLLFVVLAKLATFVYNNEFTQRLVYVAFGLGLISLLYLFGRQIRGRKFGLLLAASLIGTLYYLEYLIENKVFLVDIGLTIIFVWLFKNYLQKKLRLRWLLGFGLLYMLGSTSSVYLFVAAGLWQMYLIYRGRDAWRRLFWWALPLAILYPIYYFIFLRPQVAPSLLQFWEINEWGKLPFWQIMQYIAKHVLSTFGFDITQLWPAVGINFPVDGTGIISFQANNSIAMHFSWLMGALIIGWFVMGTISLIRRGYAFIPFATIVAWVMSFILAYLSIAPFGNNRANLFLFTLMAVAAWLGIYETLAWLWRRKNLAAQVVFVAVIAFGAWFVPIVGLKYRFSARPVYYLDGMPTVAKIVRQESKPGDLIVNFHFMNEPSFLYYYKFDTDIVALNAHPSEHLLFDRHGAEIKGTTDFYRDLSRQYSTVWVAWGAGMGHDMTDTAHDYYDVAERSTYGFAGLAKLTKK